MTEMVLLGDEAVAMGAVHAGISAAYAYPGTPSTEITEFLIRYAAKKGKPYVAWSANEKTAYEEAMGVSMVGKRALVSMKHVGLNVAADPFMNSAIVTINGGLVVASADDPGMHSSQNEQDSRYYAEFARIPCMEPADQQQAYLMTRAAFDYSERFKVPIMLRLVTRLAHSRAVVQLDQGRDENPLAKPGDPTSWTLLPANARKQWRNLLNRQKDFLAYSEETEFNTLNLVGEKGGIGVITSGIGRNYFLEIAGSTDCSYSHLHIGVYPVPVQKIRALAAHASVIYLFEDGYPYIERMLKGLLPQSIDIRGKESGHLPPDGELSPEVVRAALGFEALPSPEPIQFKLPTRPPQLCKGCPHSDTYEALKAALAGFSQTLTTSDIGCYTLGALPPYKAIESCVCMGASVSMAVGASAAGFHPVVAVVGDSTFLHSGVTGLMDAATRNANMTLIILDNQTVGMTGGQPTILPSSRLKQAVLGIGVDPEHCQVIETHRKNREENSRIIRKEIEYQGLSVIIAVRECLETAKKAKKN
ncbi:indolepyruvate ferredoxin oxidoreductase [bacterium]|nr:indolepyruvate ferredoxin oxidoreductase [bacterium]